MRNKLGAWLLLSTALLTALPLHAAEQLKVSVTGLRGETLANVRAALAIIQQQHEETLDRARIQQLHNQAEQDIKVALQPFGYYQPTIQATLEAPEEAQQPWRAHYEIKQGEQIPIADIDLQFSGAGADSAALSQWQSSEALDFGNPAVLNHMRYEEIKRDLLSQVLAAGYLNASYQRARVEVDLERYSAKVSLHINTGPLYIYGPISFEQLGHPFATDYLEQYLLLQPGDPFSQSQLSQQRRALSKSGHFQAVTIESGQVTEASNSSDKVVVLPISIELKPYLANRYRGRIGWGTDTGFGLQTDWTRRYIGQRGHSFNLGGAVVEERRRLAGEFRYLIPLDPLEDKRLELGARHESKDLTYEDVDLDEGGETRIATNLASTTLHFPSKQHGAYELQQRAGLSLVSESYDVFEVLFGNLPSSAQSAIIGTIGRDAYNTLAPDFSAVVPNLRFTLRRSDDPLYIRRGEYYNLELLGADESLGSNTSFLQARLNTWNIFPVGDSGRLLLRSALGYSDVESREALGVTFNQMPEYYEFRSGGARSIRGYGFESLFPSDGITGGKHLLVGSIEYEHEIIPNWGASLFVDGGNAFNEFDQIDEKIGVGFGLRWRSPVGLARIDVGFPLDDAKDSFQIYITVGPEF